MSDQAVAQTTDQTNELDTTEPIGCVNGVCHDDELGFDQPTNLSEAELDALVDRTMARVEKLRGQKFTEEVPVDVRSREEFRDSGLQGNTSANETFNRWNDQVWEALFVIGETNSSAETIDQTVGESVAGFYQPTEDQIVIITATPNSPTVNEKTLLHELNHALQDQRHDLTQPQYRGETQDSDLAVDGAIEGESVYLEYLYEDRCQSGEWTCFDEPETNAGGNASAPTSNIGVLVLLLQPYSDGPTYIHELRAEEGWEGVNESIASPPSTTAEIIHREPVESSTLNVSDEATDGWQRYPDQGIGGAEVAGEASIYVMLWYQAAQYGADTIDPNSLRDTTNEYDRFNYVSEPSEGWVADKLYPYKRGSDDGYVWTTEWETAEDATEFQQAYGAILNAHGATETDSGAYVISEGNFSGAYGVDVTDKQVTIVHAPTEAGLFELRPSLEPASVAQDEPGITVNDIPGFGAVAAVVGLLTLAAAGRRRTA
jgi:PGF-CTERM protein